MIFLTLHQILSFKLKPNTFKLLQFTIFFTQAYTFLMIFILGQHLHLKQHCLLLL